MNHVTSYFQLRIVQPVKALLLQGAAPEKIALSLAFGVVLGLFPVIGATTLLCMAAAFLLRLNLPAIQAANYLVYPLQLALMMPFVRAGELLAGGGQTPLTLRQMEAMARGGAGQALRLFWQLELHGVVVWLLFAPGAVALLYRIFLPAARRMEKALPRRNQTVNV